MMRAGLLILAFVSGCAAPGRGHEFSAVQAGAKSLCEVMADPNAYVGQRIVIRGICFAEPHQRLIYEPTCPEESLRVSHSIAEDGDPAAEAIVRRFRKRHQTVRVPVVYSGIVTANVVIRGCAMPSCHSYSLEESRLLAAFPKSYVPPELMRRSERD